MATNLARTISGPFRGVRFEERIPCFPPVGKTGVTGKMASATLTGPEDTTAKTKRMLLFRNPTCPVWYDRRMSAIPACVCAVTYLGTRQVKLTTGDLMSSVHTEPYWINNSTYVNAGSGGGLPSVTSTPLYSKAEAGMDNYWPTLYDEQIGGGPFIFVPENWRWQWLQYVDGYISAGTYKPAGNVQYQIWKSPGEYEVSNISSTGDDGDILSKSASTAASVGVWVRPIESSLDYSAMTIGGVSTGYYLVLAISTGTLVASDWDSSSIAFSPTLSTVVFNTTKSCLIPLAATIPEQHILTAQVMVDNTIHHSTYATLENTTKIMDKEGTITAVKVNLATVNPWATDVSVAYSSVDPTKRYLGAAEHGLSAYVEPTGTAARQRNTRQFYQQANDPTAPLNYFPLVVGLGDSVVMIQIFDGDVATASSFNMNAYTAWEYVNNFQIFDTDYSRHVTTDYERAFMLLESRCPFRRFETGTVLRVTGPAPVQRRRPQTAGRKPAPKPKAKQQQKGQNGNGKKKGGIEMWQEAQRAKAKAAQAKR